MSEENNSVFYNKDSFDPLYESAGRGRRLSSWGTRRSSPSNEATENLEVLQQRSRQLRRNNPWIDRVIKVIAANEIGSGIKPRPKTPNDDFNRDILLLWKDYIQSCNIYQMLHQVSKARNESGEVFIIICRDGVSDNNNRPGPISYKILEYDLCLVGLSLPVYEGQNEIINGIEYGSDGSIVAYHFHHTHPDDSSSKITDTEYRRVVAADVIHHLITDRPNATRATPVVVPAIVRAKTFDEYNDSELVRKDSRAGLTGTIERESWTADDFKYDPMTGEPIGTDGNDIPLLDLEAGTFTSLEAGEKINLFAADDTGAGYEGFQRFQLLAIAAGAGVPYQMVSGDFTTINDRIWRSIFNQYERELNQTINLYIIPQVMQRIWSEFVTRAVLSGVIVNPNLNKFELVRCTFRAEAFKPIHPVQDIDAAIKGIDAGLISREKYIDVNGNGETLDDVDAQRARSAESQKEHLGDDVALINEENEKKEKAR